MFAPSCVPLIDKVVNASDEGASPSGLNVAAPNRQASASSIKGIL